MRRLNRVRLKTGTVEIRECAWWRHKWKLTPSHGKFCTVCRVRQGHEGVMDDPPTTPPIGR